MLRSHTRLTRPGTLFPLAHSSSQTCLQVELIVFHEREARAVDFLCFLRQERARARLVSPAKKSHQVTSFWRELFASLSRVLSREFVVASCQSMSKQRNNVKNSDKRK